MDATRWDKIQAIFHAAVELPVDRRSAYLESACGIDAQLRKHVEAMLSEDAGVTLLDEGVAHVADKLISEAPQLRNFGHYRTLKLLGQGGMGVVYLAEREDLGNLVAIKVLRDAWLSPSRRERFDSERKVLAQLNHPCIARLYDADAFPDGTPWFVMEYVEGLPLTEYCRTHRCSIARRLQLFRAVCEAVQYAHEQAVIHRDLKPSNILVKNDGSIRLLDFGIAKQMESLQTQADQTRTGLHLMTPAYGSPEQLYGGRISIHTDVYSLGVILFELLTEELPFDLSGLTPVEATTVIAQHEPAKPSLIARRTVAASSLNLSHLSVGKAEWADLDVLCLTAMHKDPERRYRSVEALIRDIDHYLAGEPMDARPDSFRYRAGKFVRRNRRAVAVACAIAAMFAGFFAYSTVRITRARDAALAEAARTARVQSFMMYMFQGGDKSTGPSDQLRVITLLERGVMEARSLDNDPKIQAELYQTIGTIYEELWQLDKAEPLLQAALNRRKAIFGPESPEVAESLVSMSHLRSDQTRLEEAKALAQQAVTIDRKLLAPNDPALARATTQLGRAMNGLGEFDQAMPLLEQAIQVQSTSQGSEAELSDSLSELASSQYYLCHFVTALSLNQRALAIDRRLYGDRHPQVAQDLLLLGAIEDAEDNFAPAEEHARQAVDILHSYYGDDNVETAFAMSLLGRVLLREGKGAGAVGMLQHALATEERAYGPDHPRSTLTLSTLGRIALQQGKLELAQTYFERMANIYRKVYGAKQYFLAIAFSNLASVYVARKKYANAEQLLHQALGIYAKTLPHGHMDIGVTRIRLGRVLMRQNRYREAANETQVGLEILQKQEETPKGWLQKARNDLVEEYQALNRPQSMPPVGIHQTLSITANP